MESKSSVVRETDSTSNTESNPKSVIDVNIESHSTDSESNPTPTPLAVPLRWKIASILLVTAIGFGSQWSSGVTGAMKTTLKKELKINNTQFALLEASEDFMVTALMLVSGLVTDRIGGAGMSCLLRSICPARPPRQSSSES